MGMTTAPCANLQLAFEAQNGWLYGPEIRLKRQPAHLLGQAHVSFGPSLAARPSDTFSPVVFELAESFPPMEQPIFRQRSAEDGVFALGHQRHPAFERGDHRIQRPCHPPLRDFIRQIFIAISHGPTARYVVRGFAIQPVLRGLKGLLPLIHHTLIILCGLDEQLAAFFRLDRACRENCDCDDDCEDGFPHDETPQEGEKRLPRNERRAGRLTTHRSVVGSRLFRLGSRLVFGRRPGHKVALQVVSRRGIVSWIREPRQTEG